MNDMVSSRKTGGLAWSGTLQSVSVVSFQWSSKKHAVAIAKEVVLLLDGVAIGGQHALASAKGALGL
jgi:hypothetical protein